jgi:hypothetical protein
VFMPKWTQSVIEQLGAKRVRAGSEIHFLRSVFSRRFGHDGQGDEPPSFVIFGVPSARCS